MLESGNDRLVFVLNHNSQPTATTLTAPQGAATDLITGRRVAALTKTLAPNEVWVLRIAR
jgi:hypothetical protein